MITQKDIEQLKPFEARAIIEGLRKGIVPREYVSFVRSFIFSSVHVS